MSLSLSPAEVIRNQLQIKAREMQRRRWAEVVALALDQCEDDSVEKLMQHPELEQLFEKHYERWQTLTDSWEEYDALMGREEAFDAAAQIAQTVIDHGIHAFDPNHPRFREETAQ